MVKLFTFLCVGLLALTACTASLPAPTQSFTATSTDQTQIPATAPAAASPATPLPAPATPPAFSQVAPNDQAILHLQPGDGVKISRLYMVDETNGWAMLRDEMLDEHILYTRDSGKTWSDVTPPENASTPRQDGKQVLFAFEDAQRAWAVYWTMDQDFGPVFNPQVWSTRDAGQTWQISQVLDLGDWEGGYSQPKYLEFSDPMHGMLILGHDPGAGHAPLSVYTTSDGGQTWELVRSAMDEPGRVIDVCCQTGLAVIDSESALMTMDPGPMGFTYWNWSRDGGRNWELQKTIPADDTFFSAGICQAASPLAMSGGRVIVVVNCLSQSDAPGELPAWLYQSTDLGSAWQFNRLPDPIIEETMKPASQRSDQTWFFNQQEGWLVSTFVSQAGDNGSDQIETDLFHTQDGGKSWQPDGVFQGAPVFSFVDLNHAWMVYPDQPAAEIHYTSDGAATWQTLQPTISQNPSAAESDQASAKIFRGETLPPGSVPIFMEIARIDETNGWAISASTTGEERILRTQDQGRGWVDATPPEPGEKASELSKTVRAFFLDQDTAWAVYSADPGEASMNTWKTVDGGENWQASQDIQLEALSSLNDPLYLEFISPLEGWLLIGHGAAAGSRPVSLYHSTDGGQTWERILDILSPQSGTINTCCQTGMQFADPSNGLITTASGADPIAHVNWTTDGGISWRRQDLPLPESDLRQPYCGSASASITGAEVVNLIVTCRGDTNAGLATRGYLLQTSNFGKTWTAAGIPATTAKQTGWRTTGSDFQVQFIDPTHGWLFQSDQFETDDLKQTKTETTIYQTVDTGKSWQPVSHVNWSGKFSFIDQDKGWGLATNGEKQALVSTSDGGRTWTIIEARIINE